MELTFPIQNVYFDYPIHSSGCAVCVRAGVFGVRVQCVCVFGVCGVHRTLFFSKNC